MEKRLTYLDYNATSPMRPEVISCWQAAAATIGNPSSVHTFGRDAKQLIETARLQLAKLINCQTHEIIFTGSGTEANNQILRRAGFANVFASSIEHDSIRLARDDLTLIPVQTNGIIDLGALEQQLKSSVGPKTLVTVMFANNETGIIQPIADVVKLAKQYGAAVHCDAVQAIGKIPVDFTALGVDSMSISAHKFGGPQGVGALIVKADIALKPLIIGGGQERNLRAGTHNVASIAALGKAAELAHNTIASEYTRLINLQQHLESALLTAQIIGKDVERLPNTTNIIMPGAQSSTQVMALDLAGVAVSAGAACSSGKVKASHVLTAMGIDKDLCNNSIRLSTGWQTTKDDIDHFISAWAAMHKQPLELKTKGKKKV